MAMLNNQMVYIYVLLGNETSQHYTIYIYILHVLFIHI